MRRTKNMSPWEQKFDSARIIMADYWDIGSDPQTLYPGASQKQLQVWDAYQNADPHEKRQMANEPQIKMWLAMRDSQRARLVRDYVANHPLPQYREIENLLVFWYGDFYKALTTEGRSNQIKWWGNTATPIGSR